MSTSWGALVVSLWVVVILLAVIVLGMIRRVAPLLAEGTAPHASLEPQGLTPGSEVPSFQARDRVGHIVGRDDLIPNGGLFLFVAPGCPPCDSLLSQLANSVEPVAVPLYLTLDQPSDLEGWVDTPLRRILYEIDRSMTRAFQNTATPHAFAVNREGRVVEKGVVNTTGDLHDLADRLLKDEAPGGGSIVTSEPWDASALVRGGA
jgi:hypothetical protein